MIKKYLLALFLGITVLVFNGCGNTDTYRPTYQGDYSKGRISYFSRYGYPSPNVSYSNSHPYLEDTSHLNNGRFIGKNENDFLRFFKSLNEKGYGDNSNYWRWTFEIDSSDYSDSINKTLRNTSSSFAFTLENGKWVRKPIKRNPVGRLKDIVVLERGKSGVITYLLIKGSNGEYLLKGEYTIRKVLGLSKSNTGTNTEVKLAKSGEKYKTTKLNPSLLPSGFFSIEKRGGKYIIYGGGFGHGVGMSQYGAYDLTKNHRKDYKDVLGFYYRNVKLKNMYSLSSIGKTIKVGLTTNGMSSLEHQNVNINILAKSELSNSWFRIKLQKGDKLKIVPNSNKLTIYVNGKKRATTKEKVILKSSNNKFAISGLRRAHTSTPTYRGSLLIKVSSNSGSRLNLVNEVFIEDYLLQVVPSEMPRSFGIEALKAQAVAARTYALSDYIKGRYKNQGFHVMDNTMSQVYNNTNENPEIREAIKKTYGQVMLYDGKPIDAKYYSTSCGMGASAITVW